KLGLKPRRTIRVVLWTNEENGLKGGNAYRDWVGEAVHNHVAAIEMDGGSEKPMGFGFTMPLDGVPGGQARAVEKMAPIARLLDPIGAGQIRWGGGGADIGPLMRQGVPGFAHRTVGEKYFHWHHTRADTLDKIDKDDFRKNTAMLAVLAYVLADLPQPLKEYVKAE
ncbi:MAG: M28 family peptidase, partial [Acidobacteriota bacterium]